MLGRSALFSVCLLFILQKWDNTSRLFWEGIDDSSERQRVKNQRAASPPARLWELRCRGRRRRWQNFWLEKRDKSNWFSPRFQNSVVWGTPEVEEYFRDTLMIDIWIYHTLQTPLLLISPPNWPFQFPRIQFRDRKLEWMENGLRLRRPLWTFGFIGLPRRRRRKNGNRHEMVRSSTFGCRGFERGGKSSTLPFFTQSFQEIGLCCSFVKTSLIAMVDSVLEVLGSF